MEPRPGTQIHLWERAAGAEEKRWDGKSDMRGGDQEQKKGHGRGVPTSISSNYRGAPHGPPQAKLNLHLRPLHLSGRVGTWLLQFPDEKTGAPRAEVTCPRSQRQYTAEP